VQLANEQQRHLIAENERRQAHLQLLKVMGLTLDTTLELTDKLAYIPGDAVAIEHAMTVALQSRADFKAQQQREEGARLNHTATALERVPSVVGFADYGSIGLVINNAIPTRTYGFAVRLPVFDGGRRDARRAETLSQLQQERIKTNDLRQQIELEIRLALDSLRSAEAQVRVAQEGLELAERELAQARRRYEAGITSSIEVTDAQTRLERARENQINALFGYNLARISLGQAMGTVRRMIQ
jgi:outer membrane protein TolC